MSVLLDAIKSGALTKDDFLTGNPALIEAEIQNIEEIVRLFARNNEFITVEEWNAKRYIDDRKVSLMEVAGQLNSKLLNKNGYVCTPGVENYPLINGGRLIRKLRLALVGEGDNKRFWEHCLTGNHTEVENALYAKLINIEYRNPLHPLSTPLLVASSMGNMNVVKKLLMAGADMDTRATTGHSPLSIALINGHDSTAMALLDAIEERYADDPQLQLRLLTDPKVETKWLLELSKNPEIHKKMKTMMGQAILAVQEGRGVMRDMPPPANAPQPGEMPEPEPELQISFGNELTRAMLWKKQTTGHTLMRDIIMAGQLDKAISTLAAKGERITREEWLQPHPCDSNMSPLEVAGMHYQLAAVFKSENWVNRVRDMQSLWARVPVAEREQLDGKEGRPSFKRMYSEANAASIKSLQSGGGRGIGGVE